MPDVSLKGWWRPKAEPKRELILDFHFVTRQEINADFASCLLDVQISKFLRRCLKYQPYNVIFFCVCCNASSGQKKTNNADLKVFVYMQIMP